MGRPRSGRPPKTFVRPESEAKHRPGRRDNGDAVSEAVAAYCGTSQHFDFLRLVQVAADNELADRMIEWGDERQKNRGMLRMLLGNQLRMRLKRGIDVKIGDQVLEGLPVEAPSPRRHARKAPLQPALSIAEMLERLQQPDGAEVLLRAPGAGAQGHVGQQPLAPRSAKAGWWSKRA